MDTRSDSPVVVQRSPTSLTFAPIAPSTNFSRPTAPTSGPLLSSDTTLEPSTNLTMSQLQPTETPAAAGHIVSEESPATGSQSDTTPSTPASPATPATVDSPSLPPMPLASTAMPPSPESSAQTPIEVDPHNAQAGEITTNTAQSLQVDQPLSQDNMSSVPAENASALSQPSMESETDHLVAETVHTPEEPVVQLSAEDAAENPPPTTFPDPVTPPEATEPPPPPQPSDTPDWVNFVEDTSIPDEEELKTYEGKMASTSALDVKHHEEQFYPDIDDPEQRPVKKIRLTWTIKGVRGTKDKPNHARVMNSPAAYVDGFYWTIRFFPRGNNALALSAYIKCTKREPKQDPDPPESTFSFVQGGPDTDLSELKPEAEVSIPAPTEPTDEVSSNCEQTKTEEGLSKESGEAQNSGQGNASDGEESEEDKDDDEEDWRVSAQIGMIIYNPDEPRTKYDMSSEHQFNKHNDDWGWTSFHGPWSDIHRRRPGQHQALLRNDTIAMDAYIRVFDDPTQALWWHESTESEKYWDSKSLAGYFPMGTPPLYHSPGVAGITAWLLLAPVRKIFQSIDTGAWRKDSSVRPVPLTCQVQLVLHMMRNMKKDENYVNVNHILELMEKLGESYSDVVSFWEAFRRSIELELRDEYIVSQLSDIFDGGNGGRHPSRFQIGVEDVSSIQQGIDNSFASISQQQDLPKFLPIELQREKFDTTLREWKLLYNRVKLNEELDVSKWTKDKSKAIYTLYGFVVHVGERHSGKFYSILRPNGPGTKWLAFEDGEGNKVFSYTKRRIEEFEGLEGEELKNLKSTHQTAYLVMYIRNDVLKEFLPGSLETYHMPTWLQPHLPAPCHSEEESNEAKDEKAEPETHIEIYSSTSACGTKGLLDVYRLKEVGTTTRFPLKVTVPPDTRYGELRQKIAKWQDISNVEKIRLWKMKLGPLGEHVSASMEKVRLHRTVSGSSQSTRPLCLWMHVLETEEDLKFFGDPEQSLDDEPLTKPLVEGQAVVGHEQSFAEGTTPGEAGNTTGIVERVHAYPDAVSGSLPESAAVPSAGVDSALPTTTPHENVDTSSTESGLLAGDEIAGPDAEQESITQAVASTVADPIDHSVPSSIEDIHSVEINTASNDTNAAPDDEQDGIAEAVNAVLAPSNTEPAASPVPNPDRTAENLDTSNVQVDIENAISPAEAPIPIGERQTDDAPLSTAAEIDAANEAMIAALIVADVEAIDGERTLEVPVTDEDRVATPPIPAVDPAVGEGWEVAQPPQQEVTAEDVIDGRSETSSVNDEPQRPVPHVYGFIQLFDAINQEFHLHGTFIAKDNATVKETVRQALGYPEDKEFLVWTRQKSYKTAAITPSTVFEDMDFRSDGFVLIVGDVLSEST